MQGPSPSSNRAPAPTLSRFAARPRSATSPATEGLTTGWRPLHVEGRLPRDLVGTDYRSGPASFQRLGATIQHPFEAEGHTSATRFVGDGRALGAMRDVQGDFFLAEEAADTLLTQSAAPLGWRLLHGMLGVAKNTGNTAPFRIGDRLLTLHDAALPLEIDPETLAVKGEADFGVLRRAFTAHPQRSPHHRATFGFGQVWFPRPRLDLVVFPDDGPPRRLGHVDLPWRAMVHDFRVTARHAVFVVGPAVLKLQNAILQHGDFHTWFDWRPNLGATILIVDLADPKRVVRAEVNAFWAWHLLNAWDDGATVRLDVCRYDDVANLRKMATGEPMDPPYVSGFTIDLATGRATETPNRAQRMEFANVHPAHLGARHRHAWGHFTSLERREGVAGFDNERGTYDVWLAERGASVSEPVVVPKPSGDELAVWLLARTWSPRRQQSCTVILDGEHVSDGPVARVWYGRMMPQTYHGTFLAA